MQELKSILAQEKKEYDIARIVNPYACSTLKVDGDSVSSEGTCHHIWKHDHRCSNCFSRRALIQQKILYKTEVMGDKSFRIKTSPYKVAMEDGEERNFVIESVRISDLSEEKVNTSIRQDMKSVPTDYVFNEAKTGVIHMDAERNVAFANRHAKEMILRGGETEEFLLRTIVNNWIEGRQDSSSKSLMFTQRYEYGHKDYFFDIQFIPFDNGGGQELYIILHEHTDEEADSIANARDRDTLTGLYNEQGFFVAMERILRSNPDKRYTHLRFNIKNFTVINSVFGIRTGDALLQRLADLFRNMVEENGCACRFHSDHFGILMEDEYFDKSKMDLDLGKIKNDADSQNFGLLFQAGIYQIEKNTLEPEVICDRASMALRHVKDCGDRISCAVYDEEMTMEALTDNQLVSRFELAIEKNEFQMFLQPQTDANGNLKSAEALARWIREGEGIIAPIYFIPGLEKNGMIYRMDRVIWEQAVTQLEKWKNTPFKNIPISVNVSPIDISLLDIVDFFEKITEEHDVDPSMLNIEITETAMVNNPEQLLRIVDRLHRRGFNVEIDDFGSGYSSLKMLKDLNADVLKIDRGFLQHTVHEDKMKTILSSIIQMAHALGMDVITEGVETQEMVNMLSKMGCHTFQGFYFSRPVPLDEFEKMYEAQLTDEALSEQY